jgi:hypothetical protein
MMMVAINVVNTPMESPSEFEIIIPNDDIVSEFDNKKSSSSQDAAISPFPKAWES